MKPLRLIPIIIALWLPLSAQVAVKYQGNSGRRTEPAAYKVPSTFSDTFEAGSTLTVNGTFSGTPTAGTLDLSNVTVTLNGSYLTAAQVNGYFADPSTNGSFSATAWRADLSVLTAAEIAAAYQPLNGNLTAFSGLSLVADRLPYATGTGTLGLTTFSSFARTLVDDADATTARSTLGLVIGTHVQAYDAELAALAGLTSAADKLPYFTGSGTAALADFTAAGRALVNSAGTANTFPYFSASNTVTLGSITTAGRNLIDDADASAQRTTLGLGSADSPTFTALTLTATTATTSPTTGALTVAGGLGVGGAGRFGNNLFTEVANGESIFGNYSGDSYIRLAAQSTGIGGIRFIPTSSTTNAYGFRLLYDDANAEFALYRHDFSTAGVKALSVARATGNVAIASTTASTSTTSGAMTVGGGVGIAGNTYVGGNVVSAGSVTSSGINLSQTYQTRQTTNYVVSDGATSDRRLEATPGSPGAIAGLPATFWVKRFFVPTSNPSATGWYLVLSATATSGDFANASATLSGYLTSSGELVLRQNDAVSPTMNFRRLGWTGFRAAYSGQWVQIVIVFGTGDSTTTPVIYINGVDMTSSFTLNPAGAPPNWMPTTLATTKFLAGYNWPAGDVPEVEYGPGAWTAADALAAAQTGLAPTWWRAATGSAVSIVTGDNRNFDASLGNWSAVGAGASVTYDAANKELDVVPSAAGKGANLIFATAGYTAPTIGRRYRATYQIANLTAGAVRLQLGGSNQVINDVSADGTYSVDFDVTATGASGMMFLQKDSVANTFSLKAVELRYLGPLAKWEIQPGKSTAKDYGSTGIPLTLASGFTAIGVPKEINDNGSGRRTLDKPLSLTGNTTSTSTTTGELTVVGGVGVGGPIYAGSIQNTPIGSTTAAQGSFTTLSASSTVSGTGFSTYLASPPAIGGTAPAAGSFTTLSASGEATLPRITQAPASLTYSVTTNLDFASTNQTRTLALTGNVTFTTSNRVAGRSLQIIITADASTRTFSFPGWKFLGTAAPANIAANKTAVLSIYCSGTTDASVIATYAVEP